MTKDKKTEVVVEPIIKQKRGRKSKKDLQLIIDKKLNEELIFNQAIDEKHEAAFAAYRYELS